MTVREICNAIDGHNKEKNDALQWQLYNIRLICFYAIAPYRKKNSSLKRAENLWALDMDTTLKKHRISKMKPIKVKHIDNESDS